MFHTLLWKHGQMDSCTITDMCNHDDNITDMCNPMLFTQTCTINTQVWEQMWRCCTAPTNYQGIEFMAWVSAFTWRSGQVTGSGQVRSRGQEANVFPEGLDLVLIFQLFVGGTHMSFTRFGGVTQMWEVYLTPITNPTEVWRGIPRVCPDHLHGRRSWSRRFGTVS